MADGGVIEGALLSAAIGAGTSAITGGDPLKGALMGGITGGAMGAMSGAGAGAVSPEVSNMTGAVMDTAGTTAATNAGNAIGVSEGLAYNPGAGYGSALGSSNLGANALNTQAFMEPGINAGTNAVVPNTPVPASGIARVSPNFLGYSPLTNTQLGMVAAGSGISSLMDAERNKYGVAPAEKYTGPLSRFSYNPNTYQPDVVRPPSPAYRPVYAADGGLMDGGNGGIAGLSVNPNYPMADQQTSRYAVPSQMPVGATDVRMAHLAPTSMARGGIADLGGYSDGGRMLKGPGDGMSDSIPASISGKQPARLADGEFVVPADVVSHLGNGSTDAGAKQLYKMMDKVRTARTGRKAQGKQINAKKFVPA